MATRNFDKWDTLLPTLNPAATPKDTDELGDNTFDGYEVVAVSTVIDVRTPNGQTISIWHTEEIPVEKSQNFSLDFVRQRGKIRA